MIENYSMTDLDRNLNTNEDDLSDSDSDTELPNDSSIKISNPFFNRNKMIVDNKHSKIIDLDQKRHIQ